MHSLENKLKESEKQMQQLRANAQQELYSAQHNSDHVKKFRRKIMLLTKVCDTIFHIYKECIVQYQDSFPPRESESTWKLGNCFFDDYLGLMEIVRKKN